MKRTYIILIVLIAGILVGTFVFISEWNRKPREVRDTEAAYSVTTTQLMDAFKKDTLSATKKFDNNIIKVTGLVSSVDESDPVRISVVFNGDGIDLIATFDKSENKNLADVKAGKEMSFKGEYNGLEFEESMPEFPPTIRMNKCILEEK